MRFCRMSGRGEHYSQQVLEHPNTDARKVQEYVSEKIAGLYGHSEERMRRFRDQFRAPTQPTAKHERNHVGPTGP